MFRNQIPWYPEIESWYFQLVKLNQFTFIFLFLEEKMKLTMSHTNEGLNYLTYVDVYDEIIVRDYDSLEDFENFL